MSIQSLGVGTVENNLTEKPPVSLMCLSAMSVCKQWHRLVKGLIFKLHRNFRQSIMDSRVKWTTVQVESGPSITERYSHCACYYNKSLYIFGGCTSTNTTFNDLWRFDLATRQWIRPLAMGTYPSPKACASMVVHKDKLVLYGGWSHPTPYPLHQAARFFAELHIYDPQTNRWTHVPYLSRSSPRPMAGHSASIVGDEMVVFGGSHLPGVGNDEVWVFNLLESVWRKQPTTNPRPKARFGQSQVTLDDHHILIVGGCGGPNQIFNDVWLLTLDSEVWTWTEVNITNTDFATPLLWCHPACKVGNAIVLLSKAAKPIQAPMENLVSHSRIWIPPRADEVDNRMMAEPNNPHFQQEQAAGPSGGRGQRPGPAHFKPGSIHAKVKPGFFREPRSPMLLHVLDITSVISEGTATWCPLTDRVTVENPEETVFYSLSEGRGELIMFGGIQTDISMQRGVGGRCSVVSNNLYIISSLQTDL